MQNIRTLEKLITMKQSRIALVEASFSVHTRIIALMESYRSHYVVEVLDKMFGLLSVI